MKKIITFGMALLILGVLSSCQALPEQHVNFNEPKEESSVNIQPSTEVEQVIPATTAERPAVDGGEKTEPVEPVNDFTVGAGTVTPPSREDFNNFTKAIEAGDSALCGQITDETLRRQCNTDLSAKESPPQEESVSIITPGTPQ